MDLEKSEIMRWEKHKYYAELVKYLYNVRVVLDDKPLEFPGMAQRDFYGDANNEPNYSGIAQHYGLEFRVGERISVLKNLEEVIEGSNELVLAGTTSIDVNAEKKGKIKPIPHLALIGAVNTNDGKIIVGLRGRRYGKELTPERVRDMADNCYALAPGGGLTFKFNENPLTYTLEHEAIEELGIKSNEIKSHTPIAIFKANKIGPLGYKILESVSIILSSKEVIEKHKEAYEKYLSLCEKGINEKDACKRVAEEFGCGDCWEHSELLALEANTNSIRKFLDNIPLVEPIDGTNYSYNRMCGIGVGSLLSIAGWFDKYSSVN